MSPLLQVLHSAETPPAGEMINVEMLRAIGWGDAPDVPTGVTNLNLRRLLREGLVMRRSDDALTVTMSGLDVLDDDF